MNKTKRYLIGLAALLLPVTVAPTAGADHYPDAVWDAVAQCESGNTNTVGAHVGYFQFSWDTAATVGIDGSEDRATQLAAAKAWSRMIHGREGTRAGWPNCWPSWASSGAPVRAESTPSPGETTEAPAPAKPARESVPDAPRRIALTG